MSVFVVAVIAHGCADDAASRHHDAAHDGGRVIGESSNCNPDRPAQRQRARDSHDLESAYFYAHEPEQPGARDALELEDFRATVTTGPGTFTTHLAVSIRNPHPRQKQARLRIPVPAEAAVTGAVLHVSGKPMRGVFTSAHRAQAIYSAIVARKRDPLLAVWSGNDWLELSIFPLEAGQTRQFELTWVQPRRASDLYPLPTLAHQGKIVGRASPVVDGTPTRVVGENFELAASSTSKVVAARPEGTAFGYVLVRSEDCPDVPRVVFVADTSARMSTGDRARQRQLLDHALRRLPAESRVTLLAADWSVLEIAHDATPSQVLSALAALDERPSAGSYDLATIVDEARQRARSLGGDAIVLLGKHEPTHLHLNESKARASLIADGFRLSIIEGAGAAASPLHGLAWHSGGRVLTGEEPFLHELWVPLSAPPILPLGHDTLDANEWAAVPIVGEPGAWIGRIVGPMPTDARAGDAEQLRALWVRAQALGGRALTVETDVRVITPSTSVLVLESEEDYQRWGLGQPAQSSVANEVLGLGLGYGTIGLGNYGTIGSSGIGTSGFGHGSSHRGPRARRIPRVVIGRSTVQGDLDELVVRRYLRRHVSRLRYCYEKELARSPALRGKASASFVITAMGRVSEAKVSGLGNRNVESCIENGLASVVFPASKSGGIVRVSVPIVLDPDISPGIAYNSDWQRALEAFRRSGPVAPGLQEARNILKIDGKQDAPVLAWWLVEEKLHKGPSYALPTEAFVLAAELLKISGSEEAARRVLSEAAVLDVRGTIEAFTQLGFAPDAAQLERMISP